MTMPTLSPTTARFPAPAAIAHAIGGFLERMHQRSWLDRSVREVEHLQSLTDEDLRRRGIRSRDDIPLHVLGPWLQF